MNLKIQHSEFELNLVDKSFTMVEENLWFLDDFFAKYTYPITQQLSGEEDAALNFITEMHAQNKRYIFDVRFYVYNKEYAAVMEIEKIHGRRITYQIRYGLEEFPNFSKKLSELPLLKMELEEENIFEHAVSLLDLNFPDTYYNFPKVFTDRFDKETDQWEFFLGAYNNYNAGSFYENEYDSGDDIQINRNIMQPMPHVLYLLQEGFAEGGFSVAGDILTDPDLKDAWVFTFSEYYSSIIPGESQEWFMNSDEYIGVPDQFGMAEFQSTFTITEPGRYKLSGNVFLRNYLLIGLATLSVLTPNGTIFLAASPRREDFKAVDVNFDVPPGTTSFVLTIVSWNGTYSSIGDLYDDEAPIFDLSIAKITNYGPDGSLEPTLVLPNDIDLTKVVPDITFGEFVKGIAQLRNYEIIPEGNEMVFKKIPESIDESVPVDLSDFLVLEPEITPNVGRTFEFKYPEWDLPEDESSLPSFYVGSDGVSFNNYAKTEDTEVIELIAFPLPLRMRTGEMTALDLGLSESVLQLVIYNGLTDNLNLCKNPSGIFILSVFTEYWQEWLLFQIRTKLYKWIFAAYHQNLLDLKRNSTVIAYDKQMLVKSISKKNIGSDDIIEVNIEAYSLE